jgi:hypothetical protein
MSDLYDNDGLRRHVGDDCACYPYIGATQDNERVVIEHHWSCSLHTEQPMVFKVSLCDLLALSTLPKASGELPRRPLRAVKW